jgi:hypothetical protein
MSGHTFTKSASLIGMQRETKKAKRAKEAKRAVFLPFLPFLLFCFLFSFAVETDFKLVS